jgi:DNA-binding transcriptional LysR family regulator
MAYGSTQGDAGTLRVGTYQSVGIRVLPDVAARVAETPPDLRFEIHEAGCDLELLDRVHHGELDVAFCVLPAPETRSRPRTCSRIPTGSSCRPARRCSKTGRSRSRPWARCP